MPAGAHTNSPNSRNSVKKHYVVLYYYFRSLRLSPQFADGFSIMFFFLITTTLSTLSKAVRRCIDSQTLATVAKYIKLSLFKKPRAVKSTMGLVATWLNGIGLRSVVPTFEAAGIVSPSHLADLDVSYFESLGVTDPDDRRKLFYLVQRIKLAVDNKKDSSSKTTSPTAEERVDAVISENFGSEDDRDAKHKSHKGDGHVFSEEKKVEVEPARRSKRIVAKKKKPKVNSKEKNDSRTETSSPTATRKTGSISQTKRAANTQKKKKKKKVISPPSSPKNRSHAKKEKVISPPSSPSKRGPTKKLSSKIVKERKEKVPSDAQPLSSKSSIPSASSIVNRKDQYIDEVDLHTNSNHRINRPEAPMLHTTDFSEEIRQSPSRRQQPESKLPVSGRPGKLIPAASSQANSSQLSGSDSLSSLVNNGVDEVRTNKSDTSNSKARRVTLAANLDPLRSTFQSSKKNQPKNAMVSAERNVHSEFGAESTNKRGGGGSIPRISTSRSSKSMGVSESALLQQYQRNNQKCSSMVPTRNIRASTATTTATNNSNHNIPSPSTHVVTQGASEASESWGTKIDYLREDNDTEHELFRDQVGDESQYHEYYDMRIKVIVRKRPMSKSESFSGGIDIIHPLDYGSHGKTLVYQPKTRVDLTKEVETISFAFDNVFDESSTNIGIYNRSLRNLVEPFFKGQGATVFAYGQTGSGYDKYFS